MKRMMSAVCVLAGLAAVAAQAEPYDTILTRENAMPGKGQFEAGLVLGYEEMSDERADGFNNKDIWSTVPYARFGATKDLALALEVPYLNVNSQGEGADENGLGDVVLSAELLGFEDTLGYPYILPYVDLSLPTGDEDKGMGEGDPVFTFGAAIGTTVDDDWHFAVDAGYDIRSENDNTFHIGGSLIWDLDKQFSLIGETLWMESLNEAQDDRMVALGGFIYKPADTWMLGVYGGTEVAGGGDDDVLAAVKIAHTFE